MSVHFVTSELDAGSVVLQASTEISSDETADSLAQKVHALEHIIYPLSVKWFSSGRLSLENGQAVLDGEPLPESGVRYTTDLNEH